MVVDEQTRTRFDCHIAEPDSAIRFAIRFLLYDCFPTTFVPSVALHVVEFTFSGGFESLPLRQKFSFLHLKVWPKPVRGLGQCETFPLGIWISLFVVFSFVVFSCLCDMGLVARIGDSLHERFGAGGS